LEGIPGKAKILKAHETNISVNQNPQYKLVLEIENKEGQVYSTSCKTIVSRKRMVYFQPGKEVSIKIDPKNERNVIVDVS
jgi:transcriptional antiterminator Rof (Rho-off)